MLDIQEKAAAIRLVIFDVDGVLTDGSLFLDDSGTEYKAFNSRDGHGMKLLKESGVEVAIITGRSSGVVRERMANLGIAHVYQGREDKLAALFELLDRLGMDASRVAYVGDDIIDLPVMRRVGLAIAVGDAHTAVKQHAHWQTSKGGGRGAAREVCEMIMTAQGKWGGILARYL